ncbi:MAG TPA: geranylgeranyl reductase family protein [Thermoleophilaceae bacterium]|jgi:geranylgeranyl reductase family protein
MLHAAEPIDEAEIVVVGAGPAGSSCAAHLAERGHEVLLVDQSAFPRDKPCGDGLTRSAVAGLDRLGLPDLFGGRPPIEGLRMVFGYRSSEYRRYDPSPGGHQAYCVERRVLDSALLDLARARGARFLEARATSMVAGEEQTVLVTRRAEPRDVALRARFVVAADGSTSRLARQIGQIGRSRRSETAGAYAVRAYYRCEHEVAPVFNAYMPLELGDLRFPGYGWVFPIDRHTANIGVGYWRADGVSSPKRIRDVLAAFVDQLRTRERSRYGDIEERSKLFGAPLGVQFDPGRCEAPGVVLIGDAARTTDPVSGEGIAYALHGAEMIAELVHERSRNGRAGLGAGRALARRFPRLGQDVGLPLRMADRRRHQVDDYRQKTSAHPFVRTMRNVVTSPEDQPSLTETVAGGVLRGGPGAEWLERLNHLVLDTVATSFPVAAELLHSEVRRGLGPVLSVAAALTRDGGGHDDPRSMSAAAAAELVRAGTNVAREVNDRPRTRGGQANNAMCLLVGDFALSRASRHAAAAGSGFAAATGRAIQAICDAQFVESRSLFDLARAPEAVVETARARMSTLLELSLRFAGESAGFSAAAIADLVAYGRELGVAVRLAEDLAVLLDGDEPTNRPAGTELSLGAYPLPVLWAAADDAALGRLLSGDDVLDRHDEVIARASATGAIERAADQVALYAERARAALPAGARPGLRDLADAVEAHARALVASTAGAVQHA